VLLLNVRVKGLHKGSNLKCTGPYGAAHMYSVLYIYMLSTTRDSTVRSRFVMVHFYDPCPVQRSTPDVRCITQASFLYSLHFRLFSTVHVFLLFLFLCSSFKLTVIFPPMTSIKKTERRKNQNS